MFQPGDGPKYEIPCDVTPSNDGTHCDCCVSPLTVVVAPAGRPAHILSEYTVNEHVVGSADIAGSSRQDDTTNSSAANNT